MIVFKLIHIMLYWMFHQNKKKKTHLEKSDSFTAVKTKCILVLIEKINQIVSCCCLNLIRI